eukprot:298413_1
MDTKTHQKTKKIEQNSDESKHMTEQETVNYINKKYVTDEDSINLFCRITKADRLKAEPFLMDMNWNIDQSVNTYYELAGNINRLGPIYKQYDDHINDDEEKRQNALYTEGIRLWYWKARNEQDK